MQEPADLVALCEAHYKFLSLWPGSLREEWAGAVFIANHLITMPFRNHVALVRSQHEEATPLIERATAFYRDLNALPAFQLDAGTTPENFAEILLDAGYYKQNEEVWMLCTVPDVPSSIPSGTLTAPDLTPMQIEQLTPASPAALLQAYIRCFNLNFRVAPHVHAGFGESFRGLLPHPAGLHFVGLIEGEAAGALTLLHDGTIGGVYNVGTFPAFRGRGVATTLLRHLLIVARGLGLQRLLLQTLHNGPAQPIYERVGFHPHFIRQWYLPAAPLGIWSE